MDGFPVMFEQYAEMTSQEIQMAQAPNACSACKKQKRRCDKQLPQCSLCLRVGRECDYCDTINLSSANSQAIEHRIAELEALLLQKDQQIAELSSRTPDSIQSYNSASRVVCPEPDDVFPAMFFLDHEILKEARPVIPQPRPPIPEGIYGLMGNIETIRRFANLFFETIHTWFPLVSKRKFELLLTSPDFEPIPDIALLLSVMHLLTHEDSKCCTNPRTNIYWTVKNYAAALEANALMTPQVLQSKVLIAVYEIGHSVYPAAYLSVGSCAAFGRALGLDNRKDSPQMLRRSGSWTQDEALRRSWWAILLLDRYIHIGTRGHTLFTEDPHRNGALPASDIQFDQAEITPSEPLYVTSPTSLAAGPFTRTCQAAYLLGKVVSVLNELSAGTETRFANALQIYRTLTPFVEVVRGQFNEQPERYATAMALAYSAMISLCDSYICYLMDTGAHTPEEVTLQTVAIDSTRSTARDVIAFATVLRRSMISNPAAMSPLISNCLYEATLNCAWRVHEGERGDVVEVYHALRDTLGILNERWAVGGEYLACIEKYKELMYRSPLL